MKVIFKGCDKLEFNKHSIMLRQKMIINNKEAVCYSRVDENKKTKLCQFCAIKGRLDSPEMGITVKCCSEYKEIKHIVDTD